MAAQGRINLQLLTATLVGTSLVIAAACVFNNCLDRGIDQKMSRTAHRALVTGQVSVRAAIVFGMILAVSGEAILLWRVNQLTAWVGLAGFLAYIGLYSYAKRHSHHGTLVGTISGATPPVAGYAAASNHLDAAAWMLFVILVCWQMPHFYAIAMYRLKDYKAAVLPVLPITKGLKRTRLEIRLYIVGFVLANLLLATKGYASYTFATIMGLLALGWLARSFRHLPDAKWGKGMFLYSLLVIMLFSIGLSLDSFLR